MINLINESLQTEIYLIIPTEYIPLYRKLLMCLSEIGEDILKTCDCTCKCDKPKAIMECWIMFQSALAARTLGEDKKARVFIKYIETKLANVCDCSQNDIGCTYTILPVGEDMKLRVVTDCEDKHIDNFYIDMNTGILHSEGDSDILFDVMDNNLVIKK